MAEKRDIKSLKYQRDRDRKKVKGIFRNYETKGGVIKFPIKLYKEDPVETYTLKDGEVYTLPLGVAKHLEKRCYRRKKKFLVDEAGNPRVVNGDKVKRFGFQSLEFTDVEDLQEEDSMQMTT